MSMGTILSTERLNVGYDGHVVIEGVDIQAMRGQTICLVGPNGAGKSTILRTLSGMLAPVDGCVYIGREDVRKIKSEHKAKQMAVVLTEKLSLNMTTAYQVAAMGRIPYTGFFGRLREKDRAIVENALKTVGAWELKDRDYTSLSDGEKQKVLIARALAQEPQLIILDEPTSHLDIKHKIEVVRILNDLALQTGLTVILALHDIDIAVKFCQTVLMVKDGKIVAQGRPEEIVERDTVDKLYDIQGAFYDSILGSVEICNYAAPQVFVVAGAGHGIPVYRAVSRMGYGVATGVLQENDIDYAVASAMGLRVVAGKSFEPAGQDTVQEARRQMRQCSVVIDAGFPLGQENQENMDLLKEAVHQGQTVLCLRAEDEGRRLYGEAENLCVLPSITDLTEKLSAVGIHERA